MNPSGPFIHRPIATALLMAAVLLAGIVAYTLLPVSALPQVDYPTIQVLTFYPGASPDVMATTVTAPLERQFGEMQGLSQMTSTSAGGVSVIVLEFALTLNLDIAEEEVQAAISGSQSYLPADLPSPPVYSKVNPADAPILTLAVTSKTMPLPQVEDLVDTRLAPKLSQLSGVGLVSLSGGDKPAVRIEADPAQLAGYGLNLEDLRTALVDASINAAKGNFDGPRQDYQIDSNDQITAAAGYNNVVVAYRNNAPVFVRDVAQVSNGVENELEAAWMNQTPAVIVNIQRQPGANTIQVVQSVRQLLPSLLVGMPASVQVTTLTDLSTSIDASVDDVEYELLLTIGLVVLVIFLFLRSARATVIPSVAVPVSLVGTFAAMYLLGYSLDNLSLMALTISTGFVVDDAIVMVENITRYLEGGATPLQAALEGAGQIGFTIMSLTVSLIAVLIPLLFMSDVVGRLFREFAMTLAVTIVLSAVVSLTLTPMMASRLLRPPAEAKPGRIERATEYAFDRMIAFYRRTLEVVLRHQPLTLAVAVLTVVLTVVLYILIPKGFFPEQDVGVIQAITQAPQSVSFAAMSGLQQQLAAALLKDPAVASLSSFIGADGTNTTLNSGRMSINLKPLAARQDVSAADLIPRLERDVAGVAGIGVYLQPVQDITVDDRVTPTEYQYTLGDPNANELASWSGRFVARLEKLPQLADVATDQQNAAPALNLVIDRVSASRLGITPTVIDNTLYDAYGQREINTLYTQLNQYHVILETTPAWRQHPGQLSGLFIQAASSATSATGASPATSIAASSAAAAGSNALTSSLLYTASSGVLTPPASVLSGADALSTLLSASPAANGSGPNGSTAIPLSAFTKVSLGTEALSINRQGQFPVVTVSFNLAHGASLGGAITAVNRAAAAMHFPPTIQTGFQGTASAFESSLTNEPLLILAAVIVVYIVLGMLYESFVHPLTILSTLPSAAVGALLALMLFHQQLTVVAIIAVILLIGIVKKNGILIVDFALEAEREHGKTPQEAIFEASMLRFRPIMMTTMAALLAGLPLALGRGLGSELRRPLGIAMVGGLLLSQALTLYTTPVIYLYFDRWTKAGRRPPAGGAA